MPGIALRSSFSARGLGAFTNPLNWLAYYKSDPDGASNNSNECLGIINDSKNNLYACFTVATSDVANSTKRGVFSKVSPSGNLVWSRNLNLALTNSEKLMMTTDSSDNIYVFCKAPTLSLYVFKFDPSGNCLWERQIASDGSINVGDIRVYSSNVYLSMLVRSPAGGSSRKLAVAKLDTDGTTIWSKVYTTESTDSANTLSSLAIDSSGNIFVAQGIESPSGSSVATVSYLFKLDSDGVIQWAKQVRATLNSFNALGLSSIALDSAGNIYAMGFIYDSTTASPAIPAAFKFSSAGTLVKAYQYAMTELAAATSTRHRIIIDQSDNIYAAYTISYSTGTYFYYQTVLAKLSSSLDQEWCNTLYTTYLGESIRFARMFNAVGYQSNLLATGTVLARVSGAGVSASFGTIANLPKSGRGVGIYSVNTSAGLVTTTYVSASVTKASITVAATASAYTSTAVTSTTAVFASVTPVVSATSLITYVAQV